MAYLKHKNNGGGKKKPARKPETEPVKVVVTGPDASSYSSPSLQHDINHVAGLAGVEQSLDWIARSLGQLTNDDHTVGLSVAQGSNIHPIKLTLADNDFDDTMDRFVTALERIADSVAKLAGLTRPRLESWHEQDEYTPRYRQSACDGGAPGPKEVQRT
jgi:hypothetical protein